MTDDTREPVNFRLSRRHKRALATLAAKQDKAVGELVRDVIEAYVASEERRAWEAEARRASLALAEEARDARSDESETLRMLDANLEEFAREWVWGEDDE